MGHVVNYLPGEAAIHRALVAAARALRAGGVIALDVCDLAWGEARHDNVLTETSRLPAVLQPHGIEASVATSFGDERLPTGLMVLPGHRAEQR